MKTRKPSTQQAHRRERTLRSRIVSPLALSASDVRALQHASPAGVQHVQPMPPGLDVRLADAWEHPLSSLRGGSAYYAETGGTKRRDLDWGIQTATPPLLTSWFGEASDRPGKLVRSG